MLAFPTGSKGEVAPYYSLDIFLALNLQPVAVDQ